MKKLKIRTNGMVGTSHSWSITIRNLFSAFEKQGHELYLNTTNGIESVPKKWLHYFRDCEDPSIDITYTLPINTPHRYSAKSKMKLLIYNYESSILPPQWGSYHKYVDYILPSSTYCKDIFIVAGIPEEKLIILPLGVDFDLLNGPKDDFQLKTKKRFKLLNVSIPHARKNIPALVDAYLKEFSDADDICLVIKSSITASELSNGQQGNHFEINVLEIIKQLVTNNQKENPSKKMPQIEFVEYKFKNIATIYDQCDALINVASSEGFGLPLLEMASRGKLVAAPNYGGVKDFLNKNNSLLIDAVEIIAPPAYQYWFASKNATVGFPVAASIQKTMRRLYEESDQLHKQFDENMKKTVEKYTWDNTAKTIVDLYEGKLKANQSLGELL